MAVAAASTTMTRTTGESLFRTCERRVWQGTLQVPQKEMQSRSCRRRRTRRSKLHVVSEDEERIAR